MSISFFNVNSGEKREVNTEPLISAFLNSSDRGINALVGQNFGWRLAPETVKRVRDIQRSQKTLDRIAQMFDLPLDGVTESYILTYISAQDAAKNRVRDEEEQDKYLDQYEEELRALEAKKSDKKAIASDGQTRDNK